MFKNSFMSTAEYKIIDGGMETKRCRSLNFSPREARVLIKYALEDTEAIENKHVDNVSIRDKRMAWFRIGKKFNNTPGCHRRSVESLKVRYENFKKVLKKRLKQHLVPDPDGSDKLYSRINLKDYEKQLLPYLKFDVTILPLDNEEDENGDSGIVADGAASELDKEERYQNPEETFNTHPGVSSDHDYLDDGYIKVECEDEELLRSLTSYTSEINNLFSTQNKLKRVDEENYLEISRQKQKHRPITVTADANRNEKRGLVKANDSITEKERKVALRILETELEHKKCVLDEFKRECTRKENLHQLIMEEYKLKIELVRAELGNKSNEAGPSKAV